MKYNRQSRSLTLSRRQWTALGVRAGWIRRARKILVEWEDGSGAEAVGIADIVDDRDVVAYLEKAHGRKIKGWRPAPSLSNGPSISGQSS